MEILVSYQDISGKINQHYQAYDSRDSHGLNYYDNNITGNMAFSPHY